MCHFCLLSFTLVSCHPSNILSMSHAALKFARPPPMSSTTNKLHYYPTAQSRVQIRANRVQISCDIVRLSWQLVTLCYKYTSFTSRLGALRFPNRFPFFASWEMNRKTWQKKIRKKAGSVITYLTYHWVFSFVICILTRPTGSSKYGTTRINTRR